MRSRNTQNAVQDDAFHYWIENEIRIALPKNFEIFNSGALTTPDIIIRNRLDGTMIGMEIKKLVQKPNGADSRGLTMDYNSCLPCGSTLVKVGAETQKIPCFYLFALLDHSGSHIVTLIIADGDFLNYDFDIHKESKYANFTEYHHGPYAEGSVRHRKMYTYPNPLNSKLQCFHLRKILIAKKNDFLKIGDTSAITEQIIRTDKYGNSFYYYLKDGARSGHTSPESLSVLEDVFASCKQRAPKERTPSMPMLPQLSF
jgi:hypothetical protein